MPKPWTIGRLMRLVFIAAILLWLWRQPSFGPPPLFVLLAAAVGVPLIVSPFKLKRIHWTTADPNYEPFDLQSEQTPRPVTESVAAISPQLEALGFTNRGHFRISNPTTSGGVHVTLFVTASQRHVVSGLGLTRDAEKLSAHGLAGSPYCGPRCV